ncbi:trypsin-like peptidase domain-containing protein [Vibrio sp. 2094]|uniref:S1 family peptidase n=1 Tax=unclassified Vibrio TaxID=2614977 RepID=UPI0029652CC3|nr:MULTISPECIES: trypsin-like peptidase domain-containing protein [unclassified Vibrio]MDW2069571.1 trypsin-like peptidase domain-containing protein [Vibrio sp. 2096]MDW3140324.1 trypsin-like peptidase domain-containing protein [Vibrio sp. 2094]
MSEYINPIEQLIHSTVRIQCEDDKGQCSFGSGYIFNFHVKDNQVVPCIVTNKHVVSDSRKGSFNFTLKNEDGSPKLGSHELITLDESSQYWWPHPDPNIDLAIIPIGPILNQAKKDGKNFYYVPLAKSLLADETLLSSLPSMEEVVMIGYPNGIWDAKHNLPIIRRGITATHPKLPLNGEPQFLIDAACFPGSSGSPVFLANIGSYVHSSGALVPGHRVALLGTLWGGPQHTTSGEVVVVEVPTDSKAISIGKIPINLGYVIHASELLAFEKVIENCLGKIPSVPRNSPCTCDSGKKFKDCCGRLS